MFQRQHIPYANTPTIIYNTLERRKKKYSTLISHTHIIISKIETRIPTITSWNHKLGHLLMFERQHIPYGNTPTIIYNTLERRKKIYSTLISHTHIIISKRETKIPTITSWNHKLGRQRQL
jgi:hypothetical protein